MITAVISGAAVVTSSIACGLLALLHLPAMRRRARAPLSRVRVFRMAQCRPEPRRPSRDVREAFLRRYRPSDDICPATGPEFVTINDNLLKFVRRFVRCLGHPASATGRGT